MERLDRFMARCNASYYATHDPFRDFTTAPEISQVFGELLGLWAAVVWEQMGKPDPVLFVELGPGRGTLMQDALRAIRQVVPSFAAALRLHLVETSPRLRAAQATALPEATWHDDLADLPEYPMILLANEFLDALPIRQYVRRGQGWAERWVTDGGFTEHPSPAPDGGSATDGEVFEVNDAARALATGLGTRLQRHNGAALFLDYGPARSAAGESLQALRNGQPADPLTHPGSADLTAHVDFAALATATCAKVHGPVPQGPFLVNLGLFQRTFRLARTQSPARASALIQAAQRLSEPDRMGGLFKAFCLCQPGMPIPPGFE